MEKYKQDIKKGIQCAKTSAVPYMMKLLVVVYNIHVCLQFCIFKTIVYIIILKLHVFL